MPEGYFRNGLQRGLGSYLAVARFCSRKPGTAPPAPAPPPAFATRDPTTFVLAFAAWAACNGVALLWPGAAFESNPIYRAVRALPVPESAWGALFCLNALLLLLSLRHGPTGFKAGVALGTAALWLFFAVELLLGGLACGVPRLFSAGGAFSAAGAVCCLLAAGQWVHQETR